MRRKTPEETARKLYQTMLQEQDIHTNYRFKRAIASAKVAVDLVLDAQDTKHIEDYDFEQTEDFAFWNQVKYWVERVN